MCIRDRPMSISGCHANMLRVYLLANIMNKYKCFPIYALFSFHIYRLITGYDSQIYDGEFGLTLVISSGQVDVTFFLYHNVIISVMYYISVVKRLSTGMLKVVIYVSVVDVCRW